MDRRRSSRVSVQLPVEVWGIDAHGRPFSDSAMVTNLSAGGMVLEGIRRRLRPGELLDVRMGNKRSQFRVVWIGKSGELGMQNLTEQSFLPSTVLVHCARAASAC
jgi:hypothetical protein